MSVRYLLPFVLVCSMAWATTSAFAEEEWKTTASGLEYTVVTPGTGDCPTSGDVVTVHYTGTFPDGRQFDSSRGRTPFRFPLGQGQVIPGWDEGVALMNKGARFKFRVPWKLAYGARGRPPTIPAKADLHFDVELLGITRPMKFQAPEGEGVQTLEGGTRYKLLAQGRGATPTPEQGVSLRLGLFNADQRLIFSTDQAGQSMGGQVKALAIAGQTLPFLRPLVSRMRIGDRVTAEVPADQGFGQRTPDPRAIPPGSKTFWIIELESINEVPEFVMPPADQLQKTASGLQYQVVKEGTGPRPTAADRVSVLYTGWMTDGTLFDSGHARGSTTTFPLRGVIPGWTEGVQLMKVGSIYRFVIPPNLAYGSRPPGTVIKPNATLVFLIELVRIEK